LLVQHGTRIQCLQEDGEARNTHWRYLLPLDDIHNHTIDDVASLIDGRLPLHYRCHKSCQNSTLELNMEWHTMPHLLFVKQMMDGDLRNSNPERKLFVKRRKNICASLHKLKPRVECSKGILELCGAILASDSHFRTLMDAHTRWVLYDGMDEDV
jgi:hypothetical protein